MPLLDSFTVDHTRMQAPAVRLAKSMQTPNGDNIHVYDLRFTKPNKTMLSARGIHTLEHLFAFFMRQHMPNTAIIDISPMGWGALPPPPPPPTLGHDCTLKFHEEKMQYVSHSSYLVSS